MDGTKKYKRKDISTASVLLACRVAHRRRGVSSYDILQALYPRCPEKVIISAMFREVDRGNIEYGVSIGTAWCVDE